MFLHNLFYFSFGLVSAGRVIKKPKHEDGQQLQEAAIQLLDQHQNLRSLFQELESPDPGNIFSPQNKEQNQAGSEANPNHISGWLLGSELRRRAEQLGVSVGVMSVKTVLERLTEITDGQEEMDENRCREMLTSSQRMQLRVLLESTKELLSQGILCPKLLWMEHRRNQKNPKLELIYHLHLYNILTLDSIIESDESVRSWLPRQVKALCGWTSPQDEEETTQILQKVLLSMDISSTSDLCEF
uniref:Fanconi anaemia group A protein N-terminal domain-containing protein n=1 Tax=Cyprinodon variegatus TaxID=28743 RepID=A0A3Q2DF08_CYPVA